MSSRKRASSPGPLADGRSNGSGNGNSAKAQTGNSRTRESRGDAEVDERGEFEDAWEDEFEEENVASDYEDDQREGRDGDENDEDDVEGVIQGAKGETGMEGTVDAMEIVKDGKDGKDEGPIPYLPGLGQGDKLADDEELVADMSSYVFLHHARLTWPCLSFDILRDNEGEQRMKAPYSACLVAGTQADASGGPSTSNEVAVMRFEGMTKTKKRKNDDDDSSDISDDDDDDKDEDSDDDDDDVDSEATLSFRSIPHNGGVNRIRAQQIAMPYSTPAPEPPQGRYHVATFSETGKVHIFDIASHLASLQSPSTHSAHTPDHQGTQP